MVFLSSNNAQHKGAKEARASMNLVIISKVFSTTDGVSRCGSAEEQRPWDAREWALFNSCQAGRGVVI